MPLIQVGGAGRGASIKGESRRNCEFQKVTFFSVDAPCSTAEAWSRYFLQKSLDPLLLFYSGLGYTAVDELMRPPLNVLTLFLIAGSPV